MAKLVSHIGKEKLFAGRHAFTAESSFQVGACSVVGISHYEVLTI